MAASKTTLYVRKDGKDFFVYTEKEMGEAIAEGSLGGGEDFWEITIEGKPKKLNVGEWSLE